MNGNTINFRVLKKRSPGYEIRVIVSLLRCNGLNVNPRSTPNTTDTKINMSNLLDLSHFTTVFTLGEFLTFEMMVNVDSARCLSMSSLECGVIVETDLLRA